MYYLRYLIQKVVNIEDGDFVQMSSEYLMQEMKLLKRSYPNLEIIPLMLSILLIIYHL